jgi:hypothetical protein
LSRFQPFLLLLALAVAVALLPPPAWPQKPEAMRRIGILAVGVPPSPGDTKVSFPNLLKIEFFRLFHETLAKHGYAEGRNLAIEVRRDMYEQLPALARELEQMKVEVIWVLGTQAGRIVQGLVKRGPTRCLSTAIR